MKSDIKFFTVQLILMIFCMCSSLCKLINNNDEHLYNLDYVRPEHNNPFQGFKLKNAADILKHKDTRKIHLSDLDIVTPPPLKKTKKAKDTLLKSSHLSHPGLGHDNHKLVPITNSIDHRIKDSKTIIGASKPKRKETESERAERINKQFEKMLQFTALLGHVDSFLYDRTKSVVKTLHRMMGDDIEHDAIPSDYENNELRRRRHSDGYMFRQYYNQPIINQPLVEQEYEETPI